MDRTVLYREIVRVALDGEPINEHIEPVETDAVSQEINSIAANLARLQVSLRQMRPRYLAMSGFQQMREHEKDDFDYLVRQMLQTEQRRVRALEQRETQRQNTTQPRSLASRWFANPDIEGTSETLAKHRSGMFFYLNWQLQVVSLLLAELQQVRALRSRTVRAEVAGLDNEHIAAINSAASKPNTVSGNIQPNESTSVQVGADNLESEPNFEHSQMLQIEHDELLNDLNATLEKAQRAEQSLREIADMQAELSQHLSSQTQQIDSLAVDAFRTTADVSGANLQLERAKRSNRRASRMIIGASLATGIFLLLLNGR